jgi:hypothetical protein
MQLMAEDLQLNGRAERQNIFYDPAADVGRFG